MTNAFASVPPRQLSSSDLRPILDELASALSPCQKWAGRVPVAKGKMPHLLACLTIEGKLVIYLFGNSELQPKLPPSPKASLYNRLIEKGIGDHRFVAHGTGEELGHLLGCISTVTHGDE